MKHILCCPVLRIHRDFFNKLVYSTFPAGDVAPCRWRRGLRGLKMTRAMPATSNDAGKVESEIPDELGISHRSKGEYLAMGEKEKGKATSPGTLSFTGI